MSLTISVIIPAYNAADTLGKCLEGLNAQSRQPDELIVVDDGSADDTCAVATQGGALCLPNEGAKGPGGARNFGASRAKGEILVFIDADCIPPADWLKSLAAPFADPDVGAVGGGYCGGVNDSFWQCFSNLELAWRRRDRGGETCSLVSNNMACHRDDFFAHGGFPEHYTVCEDMLLSFNIASRRKVLWLADNGVIHHFLTSLPGFVRHQFHFAAESLRFFLDNPHVMAADNHQGKRLHMAILLAGTMAWSLIAGLVCMVLGLYTAGWALSAAGLGLLTAHWLLYRSFLDWLREGGFNSIVKAYCCSLIRDTACCHASVIGLWRWLKNRNRHNRRNGSHA